MNLTEQELADIEKLSSKHEVVKKLWEELKSFQEDPTKVFYAAASKMTMALSQDMLKVIDGRSDLKILGSDKDDKLYERIKSLLTDGEKIFKGLEKGRMDIDPIEEDENKKKKLSKGTDLAI